MGVRKATKTQEFPGCGRIRNRIINNGRKEKRVIMLHTLIQTTFIQIHAVICRVLLLDKN